MFKKKISLDSNNLEGLKKDKNLPFSEISIIAENMHIKGEIISSGAIRVDGRIDGDVKSETRVIVGVKGIITGNIVANSADIEGQINGKIDVLSILNLKSTAIVQGEVKVGEITIEKGAKFEGSSKYYNKQEKGSIEGNKLEEKKA